MSQHQRNIEIKAKLANAGEFEDKINIAKKLTGEDGAVLIQHDVFFQVPNGRLKLRYEGNSAKLVQYSRDNIAGPKLSKFNIIEVENGKLMEQILEESVGILGVLDKTRHVFIHNGRTRIHIDRVDVKNAEADYFGLEFEVMMQPGEDLAVGNKIADELQKDFQLKSDQLLEGSYFEILNNNS